MMSRHSGQWSVCKYLLALPALALLAVAFAEPQIMAAGDLATVAPPGTAVSDQGPGTQPEVKKVQAEELKVAEKKAAEAEFKKKMEALKADYVATSDPELKKEIAAKMATLEKKYAESVMKVDLSDPAAVENMIAKISEKLGMLDAKSRETTDPTVKEKIQQDMEMLLKKRKELKAHLAQLQAGKQK